MTERVKKYLDIWKVVDSDFVLNHEDEYEKIGDESNALKKAMTLSELESLKGLVSKREFYDGIVPLIEAKTGEPYPRGEIRRDVQSREYFRLGNER
jgi:predicted ABC-type exoprotein transport system permease subunit